MEYGEREQPAPEPMMLQDFIDRAVEEGIRGVMEATEEGLRRQGSIAGFELARELPTIEDFEFAVLQRKDRERELRHTIKEEGTPEYEAYWLHRHATVQIEWCYELMKVAHTLRGGVLAPGTQLSASALIAYGRIVGFEDESS